MSRGSFSDRIITWYRENQRDLPWRNTRDPYMIWLSEIILQQTRVNQGLPYYLQFIEKYPTVFDLAKAEEVQVLRTWQGLGYYSRARNLHKCARQIVSEFNGEFPSNYDALVNLPGIGPYTASAIASFAFGRNEAVVDGNVMRVLSRFFGMRSDISSSGGMKEFRETAKMVLPDANTEDYNQGIMEFGAIQCTPAVPDCKACPLNGDCIARMKGIQNELPLKLTKARIVSVHFTYFVFQHADKIWMKERGKGIWQGLFDFYLIESRLEEPGKWLEEYLNTSFDLGNIVHKEHVLSHRRIYASFVPVFISDPSTSSVPGSDGRFFDIGQIGQLPKPILIEWYLNSRHGIE